MKKISQEVMGGVALVGAAVAAMVLVNVGYGEVYHHILEYPWTLGMGELGLTKTIHHWINDGLMTLFFLLVGIEIHAALREGELRDHRKAVLPLIAALSGVVVPALIYYGFAMGHPVAKSGWAIPAATDIAFAMAIVAMAGDRVSKGLRLFLLTLAVVDDLIAIVVIALFYSNHLEWMNLLLAGVALLGLVVKNVLGFRHLLGYVVGGLLLWLCVLQSGVHATLAGVILGMLLPLRGGKGRLAPAHTVEHALQPFVRWVVLPLFAFANMGMDVRGMGWDMLLAPVTLGVASGLFIGKQVGVFAMTWGLVKLGVARIPDGATWRQVYGIALLCGIGFTMSLFIGALAFSDAGLRAEVQLGVVVGSLLSAVAGLTVLLSKAV